MLQAVAGSGVPLACAVLQQLPASLTLAPEHAALCIDAPLLAALRAPDSTAATDQASIADSEAPTIQVLMKFCLALQVCDIK